MARSTAEIQAEIALTRRVVEDQLGAPPRHGPARWWTPSAVLAGALVAGLLVSRVPVLRVVGAGARTVQTAMTVASMLVAVDRFITERRALRAA